MSDRPTPETEAATLNKWQDSCPLQVVPKSLAVALERQRDEVVLLLALELRHRLDPALDLLQLGGLLRRERGLRVVGGGAGGWAG